MYFPRSLGYLSFATAICEAFVHHSSSPSPSSKGSSFILHNSPLISSKLLAQNQRPTELGEFHPFPTEDVGLDDYYSFGSTHWKNHHEDYSIPLKAVTATALTTMMGPWKAMAEEAVEETTKVVVTKVAPAVSTKISKGDFNPDNFRPVCPASDGLYRVLQGTTEAIVGEDEFVQYGPLIAGGLLRVRLELCVVESFFNEAVGPFIKQNGLTWILPIHETVETFLAGTVFALATTFILVGSTKIVSVLLTYFDVFLGGPMRALGGFFFDRARGKPVTLDIGVGTFKRRLVGPPVLDEDGGWKAENQRRLDGETLSDVIVSLGDVEFTSYPFVVLSGAVKGVGEVSGLVTDLVEAIDLFVGRYLVLIATGYIGIKFLHFKIFPDFPYI